MSVTVFQDREYQTWAVNAVWDYFLTHPVGNPVVAMPTGTGKSVVIARFLQRVFKTYGGQKVMVLTHVKELIQQNYEKLMGLWEFAPAGVYSAGLNRKDLGNAITFAGIGSVAKKAPLFGKVDLIIIDEAHLVSPKEATQYQTFIAALRAINPFLRVIGLTATPWRMGHGHITDPIIDPKTNEEKPWIFTDVCFDMTTPEAFAWLIDQGYIIPLVTKGTKTKLDTSGVEKRGGEFVESALQKAVNKDEVTYAALQEAIEICEEQGRTKWLVFASGTDHTESVSEILNALGISADYVHSKRADRDEVIRKFKRGELTALVNNNILTTGFDDPEIDAIIMLRPTGSSILWVQMLGRGTRPVYAFKELYNLNTVEGRMASIGASSKHTCLVLDYAGNAMNLGPINDPLVPKRKGAGGGVAPSKECEVCETICHATARFCGGFPYRTALGCGHEFTFQVKIVENASNIEVLKGPVAKVQSFRVDHVSYYLHNKEGSQPMIRVSYFVGVKSYSEYIMPQGAGAMRRRSERWWAKRSDTPLPTSTEEALKCIVQIRAPTHLRIWVNKKPYPEIMDYCFDGMGFGEETEPVEGPSVEQEGPVSDEGFSSTDALISKERDLDCSLDDIPF